jgi:hypothetical protein
MTDSNQLSNRETAILNVFDKQFPSLTNHINHNLERLSGVGDKWPAMLMILLGALLLAFALAVKLGFFFGLMLATLRSEEFITLVLAGSGLLFFGVLFGLYQAWSVRKIILVQQTVGTEILNKQVDFEKDLVIRREKQQMGQLILLPNKKGRKRFRRW